MKNINLSFNFEQHNVVADTVNPKVHKMLGTKCNDTIVGTKGADAIRVFSGNDHVNAGDGNDGVFGGRGHDRLLGGAGNDLVRGGKGNDFISGNGGNDVLRGGHGDDVLVATRGHDEVHGGAGNDTILASAGDKLFGGCGNDNFVFYGETGTAEIMDFNKGDKISVNNHYDSVGITYKGGDSIVTFGTESILVHNYHVTTAEIFFTDVSHGGGDTEIIS